MQEDLKTDDVKEHDSKKELMTLGEFVRKDGKERRSMIVSAIYGDDETKSKEQKGYVRQLVNEVMENQDASPYLSTMLQAMSDIGCAMNPDTHIVVKKCDLEQLTGIFNSKKNQLEVCQDAFSAFRSKTTQKKTITTTLSHLLVQAYDHCRANFHKANPEHLMCTLIRGTALSGQCSVEYQNLNPVTLATKGREFEACVRERSVMSYLMHKNSHDVDGTIELLDKVFPSCYADRSPFDRLPYSNKQAGLSYKAYMTRHRYRV